MGKAFPAGDGSGSAYHDGGDQAFPDSYVKIVPSVPAAQSDRPQLRPVLKPASE